MKKNKMMRLASVLLVCVLLTTSVISGTFAKYVTKDSASDTARVAKFGVTVSAEGSLYSDKYVYATGGNTPGDANLTVKSSDTNKLVAPGTQNDTGLTFSITGTPEVMVQVDIDVEDATMTDVFLAQKNGLPDMTGDASTFDNTADYYPVKYTLTQTKGSALPNTLVNKGTLAEVKTALETLCTTPYEANTNLAETVGTLNLTWAWDFDNSGAGTYDKQDTLLGDLAAGITPTPALPAGTNYNLTSSIDISITVTQVD